MMNSRNEPEKKNGKDTEELEKDTCVKAPEWAEHARFNDDDQPCDDGR
jgi:hypothetical protein